MDSQDTPPIPSWHLDENGKVWLSCWDEDRIEDPPPRRLVREVYYFPLWSDREHVVWFYEETGTSFIYTDEDFTSADNSSR